MSLETWARNETTRYPYIVIENKPPIWECDFAHGAMHFFFTAEHQVPNRFHRLMHKLLLGITWTYVGKKIGEKHDL